MNMKKITTSLLSRAWSAAGFAQTQDKNFPDSTSIAIHSKNESLAYLNEFEITERHFFINDRHLGNTCVILECNSSIPESMEF